MNKADEIPKEEAPEELYERKSFKIDPGQEALRIDKWVQQRIENASRSKVQQAIEAGFLTVNGKPVKNNYKIKPDDDTVMVLNKPPNMVVHPGVGNYTGTLLNGIAYYLLQQKPNLTEEDLPRYGLVHRIDKNTTGLIVLAKSPDAAAHLAKQFFNHTVSRKYVALVWGNVEQDEGTVVAHVGRHQRHRKMFEAYPEGESGKHAITHYSVMERFNYVTLVQCRLETGRTHQIRVHMKHIGHTLFND